ncbi:helix-turn-helix domain-containing protein [Acidipropionibacterium jensenii]|uniref:Helix-turn-helix domain-containing protein n=1 Tax=Acidipropionibacterium jensenii TaxID=1749 RepID=A0A3T0S018_9ACTN|nr:helix-turn-helix domain-containing protein [Acidipropionibacterium jensenii]QCV89141.1 helix-turn-helix transcriptional regulator [Acidipropionibacterium jensenii]
MPTSRVPGPSAPSRSESTNSVPNTPKRSGRAHTDPVPATPQERFGAAVRARRAELGITLEQLAHASGVSAGSLSRLERGSLNPSLQSAIAISESLGSDLNELTRPAAELTVLRRDEGPEYVDPDTGIRRKLLARPVAGVELIHYTLPGRSTTAEFAPHPAKTVETFHVITGTVVILTDGAELVRLDHGDTAQTPGDRYHRISNPLDQEATLTIVTTIPH